MWHRIGPWRAAFADDAPRDELEELLERVAAGRELEGSEAVRRSKSREVFRLPLAEGRVYLKRERSMGAMSALRRVVWGSRARQEFENLGYLRAAGAPVVIPLLCAEGSAGDVLVTREIAGQTLGAALADLDADVGRELLSELAAVLARLHDLGCWHRDLHPGNILLNDAGESGRLRPVLLDLQKLRRLRVSLPGWLRVRDLAQLHGGLGTRPELQAAFIAAYAAATRQRLALPRLTRSIERGAVRRAQQRLRSRGRRCVTRSSGFRIERVGRTRIFRRADVPASEVSRAAARADEIDAAAASTCVARVDAVDGGPAADPPARLSARGSGVAEPGAPVRAPVAVRDWRRSALAPGRLPGRRAWRNAHGALLRGFETPAPLALIEERGWLRVTRARMLSRWDDRSRTLARHLKCSDAAEPVIHELGRFLGRLHHAGVCRRGANVDQLLVRPSGSAAGQRADVFLLLAPELLRFRRPTLRRRVAELRALAESTARALPGLSRARIAELLAGYGESETVAADAWRAAFPRLSK